MSFLSTTGPLCIPPDVDSSSTPVKKSFSNLFNQMLQFYIVVHQQTVTVSFARSLWNGDEHVHLCSAQLSSCWALWISVLHSVQCFNFSLEPCTILFPSCILTFPLAHVVSYWSQLQRLRFHSVPLYVVFVWTKCHCDGFFTWALQS